MDEQPATAKDVADRRLSFFEFDAGVDAFVTSFTLAVRHRQKQYVSRFISNKNIQRFQHGGAWESPGNPSSFNGGMKEHRAELETKFDDLVVNDLSLLERSIAELTEAMQRQFTEMMYSTVSDACEASGNVIDARKEGSIPESFLAMLEKIEFSADKNGHVEMPEIHVSPETGKTMLAALEAAPAEFKARVEAMQKRKTDEAIRREAERKAKFVRYGE